MSIKPSVGRIIWYNPHPSDGALYSANTVLAAIVCGIIDDKTVHLSVFMEDGQGPFARQRVEIDEPIEGAAPRPGTASWMPFQRGQANNLAGAADGIAAKVEQHIADAKASIETHAAEIIEEIKRYFATPKAETVEEKQAKLAAIHERGIVERPDGTGYDIAPEKPADPAPAPAEPVNPAPTIAEVQAAETHTEQAPTASEPAPHG